MPPSRCVLVRPPSVPPSLTPPPSPPQIQDVYQKTVRYDGTINVLDILDTAGQEDFVSMRSQWMMDKDGYIFVYSLLDKSSLRQLFNFVDLLSQGNHTHNAH